MSLIPKQLELPLDTPVPSKSVSLTVKYCYAVEAYGEEGVPCLCIFKSAEGEYFIGVATTVRNYNTGALEWESFTAAPQRPWAFFDIPSEQFLDKDFLVLLRERLAISLGATVDRNIVSGLVYPQ